MKDTEAERKESTKRLCGGGCLQRVRAEHEEYAEALIGKRMTENNTTNTGRQVSGLLEEIVSAGNLNRAYKRVKRNKGAGGVDGMRVEELLQYLRDNGDEIRESIKAGDYEPQPVRRVEIPKDNGKTRKLGIPTAGPGDSTGNRTDADANLRAKVCGNELRLSPETQRPRRAPKESGISPGGL